MRFALPAFLLVTIAFASNALALEVRGDILKTLIESSAQISVTIKKDVAISLAEYLAQRMALPQGEPYKEARFQNLCEKETSRVAVRCSLYVSLSQMMESPGPDGVKRERVSYRTEILSYHAKKSDSGYEILDQALEIKTLD